MKKKLLTFIMALVLAVPVVGSIGTRNVEAAEASTNLVPFHLDFKNPGKSIPQISESDLKDIGLIEDDGVVLLASGKQETIGKDTVISFVWDNPEVTKDNLVAIDVEQVSYSREDDGRLVYYDSNSSLSMDASEIGGPLGTMMSGYNANPWYSYQGLQTFTDWVKSETFPGLDFSKWKWKDAIELEGGELLWIHSAYRESGSEEIKTWSWLCVFESSTGEYVFNFKEEQKDDAETEEVDLSEKESQIITKEDFDKLIEDNKEKDIVIKNKDGLTFTFPKGSFSSVEGKAEYDFGTTFVNEFSSGTLPSFVTASNFVKTISFGYSGKLPGKATIKIPLGAEYAGKTLYYSYVKESGLTEVQEVTADAEGNIEVTQDHCSDYVVTTENPDTQAVKSPATGDDSFTGVLFMMMLLSLVGAGIAMRFRTKCEQ